jgi:glycosyltransferase involved in cell wall biosynthesis
MASHPLWNQNLLERVQLLKAGTTRVAFIYPTPDLGTFRYRCFNPVSAINDRDADLSASYFFLSDVEIIDDLSDLADVLVVVRTPYDGRLDRLYRKFRHRNKPIYFDIDDLVFDPQYATLVASNLNYELEGEELNQWTAFMANINRALREADQVTTTNDYLAARIREVTRAPVHVFPNSLNTWQIERSTQVPEDQGQEGQLRIAYFSGSATHALDFTVAQSALAAFLRSSPGSTFTLVGRLALPAELKALGDQVRVLPFMDFLAMQELLGTFDLNIVPLQGSAFTHSKSDLKYFEAAAVSTLTLASHNPVFSDAISHGSRGFLAKPDEWFDSFVAIAALKPSERQIIAAAAKSHALAHYSPEALFASMSTIFSQGN